ncbi:MAG TPA: ABC transporter ATP-binding protein [Gaiellaceae bacterium]|nr:ABC transporter ATP-binding protein [Gaiellaceae bacterium]
MSEAVPVLSAEALRVEARLPEGVRTIVRTLDLDVATGETVGVVGESGSGKSLTAKALVGLLPSGVHASGSVRVNARETLGLPERSLRRIRGREISLLLQDPFTMLNPLLRVGVQVVETAAVRTREEAVRRLAEVGIRDPAVAGRYPFQLSGGMLQRVALAAALASDPDILVADEPTTALDVTTQREILALLARIQEARGMGLVLITHDLRVAFSICRRIYVLYAGSVLEVAPGAALEEEPLHPYSLGLLLSEPSVERKLGELAVVEGSVPFPDAVSGCCPFVTRCAWAAPACMEGDPPLRHVAPGRLSACVRLDDIRPELEEQHRAVEEAVPPDEPSAARVREALVTATRLRKRFARRRGQDEVAALKGVSIEVGAGESVGLVGESGSGKTTLARCIVGLETPTDGSVLIDGIEASDYSRLESDQRRAIRRRVQMVFQDPYSSLNPVMTVGATLREALSVGPDSRTTEADLLARVGLPTHYAARKPVALSGGERQRVAVARALALQPRLLVCDEPVSALDVSVQAQILNLFAALRAELGLAYLFITHDLAVVRQVAERVYVLYDGEVVESGPVERVLDAPSHPYTARLVASVPRTDPDWLEA